MERSTHPESENTSLIEVRPVELQRAYAENANIINLDKLFPADIATLSNSISEESEEPNISQTANEPKLKFEDDEYIDDENPKDHSDLSPEQIEIITALQRNASPQLLILIFGGKIYYIEPDCPTTIYEYFEDQDLEDSPLTGQIFNNAKQQLTTRNIELRKEEHDRVKSVCTEVINALQNFNGQVGVFDFEKITLDIVNSIVDRRDSTLLREVMATSNEQTVKDMERVYSDLVETYTSQAQLSEDMVWKNLVESFNPRNYMTIGSYMALSRLKATYFENDEFNQVCSQCLSEFAGSINLQGIDAYLTINNPAEVTTEGRIQIPTHLAQLILLHGEAYLNNLLTQENSNSGLSILSADVFNDVLHALDDTITDLKPELFYPTSSLDSASSVDASPQGLGGMVNSMKVENNLYTAQINYLLDVKPTDITSFNIQLILSTLSANMDNIFGNPDDYPRIPNPNKPNEYLPNFAVYTLFLDKYKLLVNLAKARNNINSSQQEESEVNLEILLNTDQINVCDANIARLIVQLDYLDPQ